MRRWVPVVALVAWVGVAAYAEEPMVGDPAAGQAKSQSCACHGTDGNSTMEQIPTIAGQREDAAIKQLKDYRDGARPHDMMAEPVAELSDQDLADLAAFYAGMERTRHEVPASSEYEAGRLLWDEGRQSDGIATCTGCHGPRGQGYSGVVAGALPVVGSQSAVYTAQQLRAFRTGSRSNDVMAMMRDITSRLSNDDIDAVAEYTASLVPVP